ncbi:tRNA (adenosine(37)-N6)-threonylcarbamoyltransferase complex dimerization subunit type 1 TsaB [Heliobacterium gestii]|uniref:tRNA (Adenosine(37)-N6)-threonylcarbamoyltransferase complex dimerization subunit type 1 TsaB n=1 Tax=Heliomicrobium gestii TaxID=2699 RepID=A0A845LAE5_HELGE|nr:tRNA (adenosine(37)-N6)-threonylcarbamoyltransferase complex dimerization subunit type 1 TsaB [Heliomicrobium gestii]MBM7866132.1 tRNA threonylcarbamoyladenosine biosynthesis protein TsaB [Heliomicrobium gestii]MZP42541.1 tRNA (adenosine(37)-N6)-threonylcarbamoyltransferase complex dimerization subunit type 1 TsaB [Heliomicrobium gestii]
MYVLGIDCSTRVTALAVVDDDQVVAETFLHNDRPHSKRLLPAIEQLLALAELSLTDMAGLAVAIGPGSFTGLRIGLATVKGMAHPLGLPVVGVPTLDALALNGWPYRGYICPILDARKNEVYSCLYRGCTEGLEKVGSAQAVAPKELLEQLRRRMEESMDGQEAPEATGPVLFLGDAVPVYRDLIEQSLGDGAVFAAAETRYPRGSQVARLGWRRLREGDTDDLHQLTPMYIRPSEAEVNWAKKHGSDPAPCRVAPEA